VDLLTALWEHLTDPTALAPWWALLTAASIAVAITANRRTWKPARHLVTIAHEGGHATVGVLTGRRLDGIRLHTDTSGVTTTAGTGWGIPGLLTTLAGYPAPAAVAALILAGISTGYARTAAAALTLALLAILLYSRNLWAITLTAAATTAAAAATWQLPGPALTTALVAVAALLIAGSYRTLIEERHGRRQGQPGSDITVLGDRTRLPAPLWWAISITLTTAWAAGPLWLLTRP
jgi:hypothetical protein